MKVQDLIAEAWVLKNLDGKTKSIDDYLETYRKEYFDNQ